MSNSLWCNIDDPETNVPHQIGHSMSIDDPDRQHFEQTRTVQVPTGNSYGRATYQDRQEVTTSIDMCGYHWRKQNPFSAQEDAPKEITVDEENEDFLRGYHEGILKGKEYPW